jgi:hypothetical protein
MTTATLPQTRTTMGIEIGDTLGYADGRAVTVTRIAGRMIALSDGTTTRLRMRHRRLYAGASQVWLII